MVAILSQPRGPVSLFEAEGVPVRFLPRRAADPLGLAGFRTLVREAGIDVVHAQGYAGTTLARIARKLGGPPVVIHSHEDDDAYPGWLRWPDRLLAGSECAALAVSDEAKRFFERARSIEVGRTEVLANGVDLSGWNRADVSEADALALRGELGVRSTTPLVVNITRFRPEKGNDVLIDAWPRVLERVPDAVLLLAGEGETQGECRAQATALGLGGDRVRFLGFRRDVLRLLSSAQVVVAPSRREGSPFSLLEAMAVGAPIVASAVGGMARMLEDGVSGRLVPADDPPALASAVASLLADPVARETLGKGARDRAGQFDIARHAERLEAIYRACCDA